MRIIKDWEDGQEAMKAIGIDEDTSRWTTNRGLTTKTTYYRNFNVIAVETIQGSFQQGADYELKIYC